MGEIKVYSEEVEPIKIPVEVVKELDECLFLKALEFVVRPQRVVRK